MRSDSERFALRLVAVSLPPYYSQESALLRVREGHHVPEEGCTICIRTERSEIPPEERIWLTMSEDSTAHAPFLCLRCSRDLVAEAYRNEIHADGKVASFHATPMYRGL